jgi:hypothetical protein
MIRKAVIVVPITDKKDTLEITEDQLISLKSADLPERDATVDGNLQGKAYFLNSAEECRTRGIVYEVVEDSANNLVLICYWTRVQ